VEEGDDGKLVAVREKKVKLRLVKPVDWKSDWSFVVLQIEN
jgi:hypothetical protein